MVYSVVVTKNQSDLLLGTPKNQSKINLANNMISHNRRYRNLTLNSVCVNQRSANLLDHLHVQSHQKILYCASDKFSLFPKYTTIFQ